MLGKRQVEIRNQFSPDETHSNTQASDAKFNPPSPPKKVSRAQERFFKQKPISPKSWGTCERLVTWSSSLHSLRHFRSDSSETKKRTHPTLTQQPPLIPFSINNVFLPYQPAALLAYPSPISTDPNLKRAALPQGLGKINLRGKEIDLRSPNHHFHLQ
jgi:hypothetical protein